MTSQPAHPLRATARFAYRTQECPECEGSRVEYGMFGGGPYPCDYCGGLGWIGCDCADCDEEKPLNGDGLCAECMGLTEVHGDPMRRRA